jgi:precorrin-3B synthase
MTAGDACPGILDLHEARDGHVARIRLPGGYASPGRLRAVAALAGRFGDGSVDLTARGNVQLRGLRPDDAEAISRRAAATGLLPSAAHDRARNLTASPLAGLAGHPGLRRVVGSLDRALLADPELAALPGRFLFAVDDGGGRAGLGGCDLGLRRVRNGFELVVAGRATGVRASAAAVAVARACALAREFLRRRRALGLEGVNRVADLPDGGAALAAAGDGTLGDPVVDVVERLPLGVVLRGTGEAPGGNGTGIGEAPGRTGTGNRTDGTGRSGGDAAAMVAAAPLGRLSVGQLDLVAGLVRRGEVARVGAAGRIVVPPAEPAEAALARLAAAGLLVSDDHPLAEVTSCSGTGCVRSLADVRAVAGRVRGAGAVHWAGCSRRCGLPADAVPVVAAGADRFAVGDDPSPRPLAELVRSR